MSNYENMTDQDFDRILFDLIDENNASNLLMVPGVYEVLPNTSTMKFLTGGNENRKNKSCPKKTSGLWQNGN